MRGIVVTGPVDHVLSHVLSHEGHLIVNKKNGVNASAQVVFTSINFAFPCLSNDRTSK
jgi:hypothetical protein